MQRRAFVKKSVSAAILTPLAFTGLINAAGAVGGGPTTTIQTTGWFTTTFTDATGQATSMECDPAEFVRVKKNKNSTQWLCTDATRCHYNGKWNYHKRKGLENAPWELCDGWECDGTLVSVLLDPPCDKKPIP